MYVISHYIFFILITWSISIFFSNSEIKDHHFCIYKWRQKVLGCYVTSGLFSQTIWSFFLSLLNMKVQKCKLIDKLYHLLLVWRKGGNKSVFNRPQKHLKSIVWRSSSLEILYVTMCVLVCVCVCVCVCVRVRVCVCVCGRENRR